MNQLKTPIKKNSFEDLTLNELTELQTYLEKLKNEKIRSNQRVFPTNRATDVYDPIRREVPVDWRTFSNPGPFYNGLGEPGVRGSTCTRVGKKSDRHQLEDEQRQHIFNGIYGPNQLYNGSQMIYKNPYEYGAKQNVLEPIYQQPYVGPYYNDPSVMNRMALNSQQSPSHIRNIDVESVLLQKEATHLPGQKQSLNREVDRFERLPFDPQNHRHLVWTDNMPRGGYPTRVDRLEL